MVPLIYFALFCSYSCHLRHNPAQRKTREMHLLVRMKRALWILILVLFTTSLFGQAKPLSQADFVKMLYALQSSPATKTDIIAALRTRGIDFDVTDGIRGLTRSKSGNDEEIRRALDEADRRRKNPESAIVPNKAEADALLAKTRQNTLGALEDMPDFVVKQQIQRSIAYAGTGTYTPQDNLIVAVSYRATGEENYRVLMVNGIMQTNTTAKQSYEEVGGTSSTGEFVTMLAVIFKPESLTKFEPVETDIIRARKAVVFDFEVAPELAQETLTCKVLTERSTRPGIKGKLWIDTKDARVLKVESEATSIPPDFPCPTAKRNIDYDWVTISDEKYLLPLLSDVRLTVRDSGKTYETRNVIRFKNYQKYGSQVIIRDDDTPEPVKKPE